MLSGARVLVAEDESLIAMDLADAIENAGAVVLGPVATVRDALHLLSSEVIDTALLDFNLKDGEVTPALDRLLRQGVPVIVYTGGGLPDELLTAHPRVPVLRKPLPNERVIAELTRAVNDRRLREAEGDPHGRDQVPPPLPRQIQEHLGRQLRAAYSLAEEKPRFLGEPALPTAFEPHLARLQSIERVEQRALRAVAAALRLP